MGIIQGRSEMGGEGGKKKKTREKVKCRSAGSKSKSAAVAKWQMGVVKRAAICQAEAGNSANPSDATRLDERATRRQEGAALSLFLCLQKSRSSAAAAAC